MVEFWWKTIDNLYIEQTGYIIHRLASALLYQVFA